MTPLDALVGGATSYLADAALIGGEIVERVRIDIAADGTIAALHRNAETASERLAGLVVPGIANLHSHAFQRAMAGLAERAGPDGDNFWRWREVMYRFLAVLTPEDVQAIAAQLYVECLLHGYTAVAEFHYLHNAPDGTPYADPAETVLAHRRGGRGGGDRPDIAAGAVSPGRLRRGAAARRASAASCWTGTPTRHCAMPWHATCPSASPRTACGR